MTIFRRLNIRNKELWCFSSKMPCNVCSFFFKIITSSKWSSFHEFHSVNCCRRVTITSQQTFISRPNFDPDVPFRLLTWWYSALSSNWRAATSGRNLFAFVQLQFISDHNCSNVLHARENSIKYYFYEIKAEYSWWFLLFVLLMFKPVHRNRDLKIVTACYRTLCYQLRFVRDVVFYLLTFWSRNFTFKF